jgi:vaccinia related kinase
MPPKKTAKGHVKCDPIPEGTIYKVSNKREVIVGKEFAQGGFGRICDAKLVGTSEKYVIKIEPLGNGPLFTEMHVFQRILRSEMLEAYKKQHKLSHLGLPYLVASGTQEEIRYLVMPKYSYCLDQIVKESRSPLKLENVVEIVQCIANALQYMHRNDYVHADIKAANIMMNKKNSFNEVYLIDFGLARRLGNVVEKEVKKNAHDGTAYFTSTDAHRGVGCTFRGDAEILAHNALYWITKTLPWMALFDEEATIKVKAQQLNELLAAKQKLISNLSTDLKKIIPDASAASVVQMLYNSSKIDINEKPDFDEILKSLKTSSKGKKVRESDSEDVVPQPSTHRGRKKEESEEEVEQEESEDEAPPPKSSRRVPASKAAIQSSSRRGRKKEESEEDEFEPAPPKSSRHQPTSNKKIVVSGSEEDALPPLSSSTRRGRKHDESEEDEAPPPKSTRRLVAANKQKPVSESDSENATAPQSSTHRGRRPQTVRENEESVPAIYPGMKTKMAGRAAMPSHQEESEEEAETPQPKFARRPPPKDKKEAVSDSKEDAPASQASSTRRGQKQVQYEEDEEQEPEESEDEAPPPKSSRSISAAKAAPQYSSRRGQKVVQIEEDETEQQPPKSSRRYPTTPKLPARSIINEGSKVTPSKTSKVQNRETFIDITPSPRKYPVDDSSPYPVKKPRKEFKPILDSSPIQALPSSKRVQPRARSSEDIKLFSPRMPSSSNHQQYYTNTEPKPRTSVIRPRSRSLVENSPPISPEVRISAIPQPKGCSII